MQRHPYTTQPVTPEASSRLPLSNRPPSTRHLVPGIEARRASLRHLMRSAAEAAPGHPTPSGSRGCHLPGSAQLRPCPRFRNARSIQRRWPSEPSRISKSALPSGARTLPCPAPSWRLGSFSRAGSLLQTGNRTSKICRRPETHSPENATCAPPAGAQVHHPGHLCPGTRAQTFSLRQPTLRLLTGTARKGRLHPSLGGDGGSATTGSWTLILI